MFKEILQILEANTPDVWLTASAVAVLVYVLLTLLVKVVVRRLSSFAGRTRGIADDAIVHALGKTGVVFRFMVAVAAGARLLDLGSMTASVIQTLLILSVLLQAGLWVSTAIGFVLSHMSRERQADAGGAASLNVLAMLLKIALWSVVLLIGLDNVGVDVTGLVAGLGISGIAVALALQNILGDLFASLSIVLDKPFEPGDFIVVGEHLGTVEHIGWKTTRVRSLSGEQLVFANTDLLQSRIRNFKRMQERRVLFTVGVTYDTPEPRVRSVPEIIREAVEGQAGTRFDRAHFKEFGDSAFLFEAVYYVLSADYNAFMDVQQRINLAILARFRRDGIEFAFPTRTLFVRQEASAERRVS